MASSNSRPPSVRGLYTPPAEEWVFLPPSVSPPANQAPPTPSHLPSPFLPSDDDDAPKLGMGLYGPLQLFAAEYFTTAIGMPFEVGKTLLQIEYRPRKNFAPVEEDITAEGMELPVEDDLENPEEAEVYFSDRLSAPSSSFVPPLAPSTLAAPDASGYLPDLHPSWLLLDDPDISRGNGVWGMIRRIRKTPSEGLPGLWKSQLVTTFHSMISNILQPQVNSFLLLILSPTLDNLPLTALPNPALPLLMGVGSHLITHLILSPMEVIRTRLIAAPTSHPSTPSSVAMFRQMIKEEGGFASLYFHPNLLLPSILEHTIRPILTLSIPLLLERQFGISPELSPLTYSMCDLSLGLASLLVILPIETVRRRLQLQNRGGGKRGKSIVRLRETDYVGVVEGIWRIVTEETGVRRKRNMSERDEGGVFAGIRQLYRGFGMAATAHLTVFTLGVVSQTLGGRGDSGWKEI